MEVRISKYDPKHRQEGIFTKEDWTAVSDIGKVFDGVKLTKHLYVECEQRYVHCILDLLKKSKQELFSVTNYEDVRSRLKTLHYSVMLDGRFRVTRWKDKQVVKRETLELFIRDCLRENCWGKLESKESYIHFGYDYYVYMGIDLDFECIAHTVCNHGLFFEVMKSPYVSD